MTRLVYHNIIKKSRESRYFMKATNYPHFTLRINPLILDKLGYIAKLNGRSKNKEVEFLIKQYIEKFENEHGKITYEDMNKVDIN